MVTSLIISDNNLLQNITTSSLQNSPQGFLSRLPKYTQCLPNIISLHKTSTFIFKFIKDLLMAYLPCPNNPFDQDNQSSTQDSHSALKASGLFKWINFLGPNLGSQLDIGSPITLNVLRQPYLLPNTLFNLSTPYPSIPYSFHPLNTTLETNSQKHTFLLSPRQTRKTICINFEPENIFSIQPLIFGIILSQTIYKYLREIQRWGWEI